MRRERHIELPELDSLPQAVCRICNRSLIRGLFTPLELANGSMRCRTCCGELSEKSRRRDWNAGKEVAK